jgi:hypothetical protein
MAVSDLPRAKDTLGKAAARLGAHADTPCALLPRDTSGGGDLGDHLGRPCSSPSVSSPVERGMHITAGTGLHYFEIRGS